MQLLTVVKFTTECKRLLWLWRFGCIFPSIIIESLSRAATVCGLWHWATLMQTTGMPVDPCCWCFYVLSLLMGFLLKHLNCWLTWSHCLLSKCLFTLLGFKLSAARVLRRNTHGRLPSSPTAVLMNPGWRCASSSWILVDHHHQTLSAGTFFFFSHPNQWPGWIKSPKLVWVLTR